MSLTARRLVPAAALATSALLLAACGSGGSADSVAGDASDNAADGGTQGGYGDAGGPGGQFPGASGQIAAVSGRTLQVQSQMTGQVAVTYTGKTTITAEVKAARSDIKVGSCVVVTSDATGSGSSTAPESSSTGSPTQPTAVTASSVRVSAKVHGSCGGFGGRGVRGGHGAFPSGRPSDLPSGMPSDRPSGGPGVAGGPGGRRMGFGVSGEVTAVSGSGFTVRSVRPSRDGSTSSTAVTVTVTGDTTYATTKKATASSLRVGKCVTALGRTDDTGALTATTISVSDPVGGECTAAFGRGGR